MTGLAVLLVLAVWFFLAVAVAAQALSVVIVELDQMLFGDETVGP